MVTIHSLPQMLSLINLHIPIKLKTCGGKHPSKEENNGFGKLR
jgi:hypothetical protein